MSIIKISILLRRPQVAWSYRESGRDFWNDILNKISIDCDEAELIQKNAGSLQHCFYLKTARTVDYLKESVSGILDGMIVNSDDRSAIIVSVTEPDSSDLAKLKESVDTGANKEFWLEADTLISEAKTDSFPVKEIEAESANLKTNIESQAEVQTVKEDDKTAEAPAEENATLSYKAEKISVLKKGLLKAVKGQRHAVDEVVRSFFECEMFATYNENRKGPLATFLFTGPSGVGKTFLAEQCGELLGRPMLVVDMSEYSSNIANAKFNGDHGESAVVTGFVRNNPKGIIVFDEVEKAHINTIHLFLQILDGGRLMDHQIKKEVSFRDTIIIMTTNAGKELYEDATVCDLSSVPRGVILDALRTDINPQTREPFFPECITTRMANGNVILFNHLEPYALMEIIGNEIAIQMNLFEKSSGVKVSYDSRLLSALVLYHGGGVADARSLRGLARNVVVSELQEIVMQILAAKKEDVDALKNVSVTIDTNDSEEARELFVSHSKMSVVVFSANAANYFSNGERHKNTEFDLINDKNIFIKRIRGVVDYVLLDPLCNVANSDRIPNDIEDVTSDGMEMFEYLREYYPEIPVYILDNSADSLRSFDTLLAKGARGIIRLDASDIHQLDKSLDTLAFNALINNGAFALGRSGKFLTYNCAQYMIDKTSAIISFEKLHLRSAPKASDGGMIVGKNTNTSFTFKDIIGCKTAKETLREYCKALDDPRATAMSGKRMPKGILLYGPPGTGKTMLAKAMANECNATFIPTSATTFFASLVGETEKNIRDIFKKARKYAPSIIFVDEVDAIGRMRTGASNSIHNEDALNAFLAEMDGFVVDEKRPVFIFAATNYELEGDGGRVLDPAFVRRFDSKVHIPLPDADDRYELLCMSLKKHGIHFGNHHEITVRNMAERTGGMNNADLEALNLQYARLLGDAEPDSAKYMDTLDAYRFGEVNKMNPDHLRQTACHEAGHALVCRLFGTTPSFLTVVSRGNYGGFMESASEDRGGTYSYDELMGMVCRCLAGRVAEIEVYGESLGINTGASSDIKKARYYIRACLDDFAMGNRLFGEWDKEDAEKLIVEQYERTRKLISDNRLCLEHLTDLLAKKKSLDRKEMEEFFASENI